MKVRKRNKGFIHVFYTLLPFVLNMKKYQIEK